MEKAGRMKRIVLILVVLSYLVIQYSIAQDVNENSLLLEETRTTLIKKGRELLLDKFLVRDKNKVKEIEHYLNTLANEDYLPLDYQEQWLIDYWTNDYQSILQSTSTKQSIDSLILFSRIIRIRPSSDYLYIKLKEKMCLQQKDIEQAISTSDLSQSDKDFLIVHFYSCLKNGLSKTITQDTINELSDRFIQNYPNNSHIGFVRNSIRYKYVPSNWGVGMELTGGYGIFTHNVSNHFSNVIPIGLAFDVSYKNVVFSLGGYTGNGHTLHDFTGHTLVWPQQSSYSLDMFELSLGYRVHDGKHFKLEPFVGIGTSDITPSLDDIDKQPYLDEYEWDFTTYKIGLNLDYMLTDAFGLFWGEVMDEGSTNIRLQYAFCLPQFSKKYPGFEGNLHSITIGIGGFGRNKVRDK